MSVFTNPGSSSAEQTAAYVAAVLDLVGTADPIQLLCETVPALEQVLRNLTREQLETPEKPGKWSVRDVVQHLADSELVWAYRLRMVLAQDRPLLTGYDQDVWAERLQYASADASQALRDFGMLRASNLRLLGRASPDDMQRVGIHEQRGEETLEHMVRLYAGHGPLHLRQIARITAAVVGESGPI